jgi:Putative beta-barrel porin-2, OmpL-like. bbp2
MNNRQVASTVLITSVFLLHLLFAFESEAQAQSSAETTIASTRSDHSMSNGANETAKPANPSSPTASPDSATPTPDPGIPPAVAKELAAMKAEIEELKALLLSRGIAAPAPTSAPAGAPAASAMTTPAYPSAITTTPASAVASVAVAAPAPAIQIVQPAVPIATAEPNPPLTAVQSDTQAATTSKPAKPEPFSLYDYTWLTGNPRIKEIPFDSKFFSPEIRFDVNYTYDFNHPSDDTIGGSSEIFRAQEFQVTQAGVGGDFHWDNVQGRFMTQFGMYSETTPRNDASPARGGWDLDTAYRYISEAYGGYHINALNGINVQAGIFMSYIGLFSYYQFDNWAYQPSYVSSNTPWFFNGMRVQIFPTAKLKIEPWLINGWQSYGRFNNRLGVGGQILWRPTGWFSFVGNQYGLGADDLGIPNRIRYHTDDSIQVKYYERPGEFLNRMAFTLTGDAGCEHGGDPVAGTAVSCDTDGKKVVNGVTYITPKQSFLGFMAYNRWWFKKDRYGVTLGGGKINNPGRYLVLLPPINGATAITGSPYFTENPGDPFKAWDASFTFDYMPSQYITFRSEFNHRVANVPYFTGRGGITPPGGDNGNPGVIVPGFTPDLVRDENRMTFAILVMF